MMQAAIASSYHYTALATGTDVITGFEVYFW
jgi:hypothetical protein